VLAIGKMFPENCISQLECDDIEMPQFIVFNSIARDAQYSIVDMKIALYSLE
jgi:hypothetical protein